MTQPPNETELLAQATRYSFRARMDKKVAVGPVFAAAKDSVVTDVNGKDYLDFNSGQMCAALGHNHPRIVAAIKEACDTMLHAHSSHYNIKEIQLAARLGALMPDPLQKSLFGESGSDANDCYRCPLNHSFPRCEFACLTPSFALLDAQSTGRPAAVITEPLFSAGGVVEPPPGWLKQLQELCHERGMLLIVDEEQTGLGKLGAMFGFERDGIVPDIVTVAKHLGGGVGVSAVTTSAAIEEKVVAAGYSATHSHSNDPLICAAGIASLDIVEEEDVPAKARRIGAHMHERLGAHMQRYEMIGDIRGRCQLTGVELVRDRAGKEPATDEGRAIGAYCFERGLIFSLRRNGSVLRFVPPATTTPDQIDHAMDILGEALEQVSSTRSTIKS